MKMREAIKAGKSFSQWLNRQSPKPRQQDVMPLETIFNEMRQSIQSPPFRTRQENGKFIVLNQSTNKPNPNEEFPFVIHSSMSEAGLHGKNNYGYRQFKIVPFMVWERTWQAKVIVQKQKVRERLKGRKSQPQQPAPTPVISIDSNKAKRDSLQYCKQLLIVAEIKGNFDDTIRLKAKIKGIQNELKSGNSKKVKR